MEKVNDFLGGNAEPQVQEVAPGINVEEIKALYFDANALREPPYKVYQLNWDGYRYYYRADEDGTLHQYPSVTTLLKQVMPTPPGLIDWMLANGKEGAAEKRDTAAAYGTFMHAQFEYLIINRSYDFDEVPGIVLAWLNDNNLPDSLRSDWCVRIRKDILAFAQFVRDYNVRPLAIEIGLVHPIKHYAGCIDLPCIMTEPKTGEDFTAIVDFKSGRKGFYEEHELQLHLYKDMWEVNFPELPIQRVFNFSPKDWRKKPTYNLKDQTDSVNAAKIPHLLALAGIEDEKRDNTITVVRGVLNLDDGNFEDNVLNLSLSELIKEKKEKKEAPSVPADETDKPKKATKKAVKATKVPEPINTTSEPKKPVKTEINEKLPWETEEEKPAMVVAPEELAARAKQAAKDNLLNDEIEL